MGNTSKFNKEAKWIPEIEANYCRNVESKTYQINEEITAKVMQRMPNNKAPGFDLLAMFWYKKLDACIKPLTETNKHFMELETPIPNWLPITRTTIIPKNENTDDPKKLSTNSM